MAAAVWQTIQSHPHWGGQPELFDCLLDLDQSEVKEWLLTEAYEPDGAVRTSGRRAWIIRTLGKWDGEAAFRACESALLSGAKDSAELAVTLLELDVVRGISAACRLAAQNIGAEQRYSLGMALRTIKEKELLRRALEGLLKSHNSAERKAAVELAGWVGPNSLTEGSLQNVLDDDIFAVREAARDAILLYQAEKQGRQLIELFKGSRGSRAWSLLDAILSAANPHALQTKGDPLYLGDATPDDDMPYWLYSRKRLQQRSKDVEKELSDIDRRDGRS